MKGLKKQLERIRPHFQPGGKLSALHSVYDGMETFLFTPNETAAEKGAHIRDANDSKRTMIIVVMALMPCFLFGMYNTAYQHWLAAGASEFPFWTMMLYGFLAVLPRVIVSYLVGLGIEFVVAQWRKEEIQEGFLVTGILIPMICPIETPLWMIAVATAFAVIFVKEVFGGTGYNILNVALVTRAFLFFAYPKQMSGDNVFVATDPVCGIGGAAADGFTGATPLGEIATATSSEQVGRITADWWNAFIGLIPGSFGETSTLCVLIGAAILLFSGMASWKIMLSALIGGLSMGAVAHAFPSATFPASYMSAFDQLIYGGFAFAIVFMATDPVTAARTETGKWIYGFLVGAMAIVIRVYNSGYPEGAMLAVLLMNVFAPLIDYCVVQSNVKRRLNRVKTSARS
ncbi:MAG: NADH:ubiquinone reductase (Na(+)-transporting) subunit B [Muribaculaceae bacterium]|nr:NADH:ubiquinone reductase (Na(+)-transporting) subunit B [Muribaculaceae bacterium]MDE6315125.1 NADH:ubiquinone reductase (Na(+)-transporting) subunit B [Muribaculaceae bacterium]